MNRLTDEQRALAGDPRHVEYALALARRAALRWPGRGDEIESHAMLGLVAAASTWEPARGKFKTWLYHKVRSYIGDGLRHEGQARRREAHRVRWSGLCAETVRSDSGPVGWELDSVDAAQALIASVPVTYRASLRLRYLHGYELRRVAEEIGLSTHAVRMHLTSAAAFLREQQGADV